MILTKSDNDIIIKHFYEWNKSAEVHNKLAIDVYINSIEYSEDDILFNCTRISPILDDSCGISEDSVGKSKKDIGDDITVKLSDFESPYNEILKAAIREIKIEVVNKI